MRTANVGWFLVRYEDDGAEEWLRLSEGCFNSKARCSWRVDLDFDAAAADGPEAAGSADEAEEEGDEHSGRGGGCDGDDDEGGDDEDDEDGDDEDDGDDDEEGDYDEEGGRIGIG